MSGHRPWRVLRERLAARRRSRRADAGEQREQREQLERFTCPHEGDYLCDKYGCPDDPNWRGDRR